MLFSLFRFVYSVITQIPAIRLEDFDQVTKTGQSGSKQFYFCISGHFCHLLAQNAKEKFSTFWLVRFRHVRKLVLNIYEWTLFSLNAFVYALFSLQIDN